MRPRVAAGDTLPDLSLTSRAGRNLAGTGVSPPPVDPAPQVPAPAWRGPGSGAGRLPALDGLRAVAVLAVLGYHAGLSWLPGGLLGVDAFFVLSGYLITSLLLAEWQRTGRIDLRRFWVRRARRLLPALLLVVLAVAVTGGWLVGATGTAGLRWDALAALGYVANWRFALSGQGYFDHFTVPSPLLHLWSLGVEEQFYLIWPLLALLALWVAQRRGRQGRPHGGGSSRSGAAGTVGVAGARAVLAAAAIGAAASTTLLAALAVAGADDSRLYYGTDTRAAALLVGACLAAAGAASWRPLGRARAGTTAAGLAGLAGTAVFAYAVLRVDGQDPVLYRGGFLVVALAVAAIVNAAAVPADVLTGRRGHHYVPPPGSLAGAGAHAPIGRIAGLAPRVLSLAPLAYLGRISYGLYLWHWPAYLLLTRTRTGLSGGSLLAARLAATRVVAVATYHQHA
jgi:peptidoglycan/LPS O-acetylase OafA/YrhL